MAPHDGRSTLTQAQVDGFKRAVAGQGVLHALIAKEDSVAGGDGLLDDGGEIAADGQGGFEDHGDARAQVLQSRRQPLLGGAAIEAHPFPYARHIDELRKLWRKLTLADQTGARMAIEAPGKALSAPAALYGELTCARAPRMTRRDRALFIVVLAQLMACVAPGEGEESLRPTPACAAYLECVLVVAPAGYPQALDGFGSDSSCWEDAAQAANCDRACTEAREDFGAACVCDAEGCHGLYDVTSGEYAVTGRITDVDDCQNILGEVATLSSTLSPLSPAGSFEFNIPLAALGGSSGPEEDELHGYVERTGNVGRVDWSVNGARYGSEEVLLTGDDLFETEVDLLDCPRQHLTMERR
ncbi:MAG: hypothetical protein ACK6CU_22785 [Deltaproteobacteria bacterium]|jgi:hypothetical protein